MALIARDAGCSFPGCTHPPQWCDRHHILDWILGGLTDLDNLTLLGGGGGGGGGEGEGKGGGGGGEGEEGGGGGGGGRGGEGGRGREGGEGGGGEGGGKRREAADTTTPTSCRKAGPAASMLTGSPNGSHRAGSTTSNDPTPTPASNASTPNANCEAEAGDDGSKPPQHEHAHVGP